METFKIGFVYPGYENLGIEYLSARLKKHGFATRLFFDPILFDESGFLNNRLLKRLFSASHRIIKEVQDYKPDLLCFSVTSDNYQWASRWAGEAKKLNLAPVVFGGIHPSSVPDKVISNPFVDYICVGEGDEAIVELAEALAQKKPTDRIKNIWAKLDGQVKKNELRPLISDLDAIPLADKDLFYSAAPIFDGGYITSTSRGCPYSCSYCCNDVWKGLYAHEGKMVRRRSPENVINELLIAKSKYKIRYVNFWDEVFNSDQGWLKDFLPRYKEKVGLPFFCFVYPDLVTEGLAAALKDSGCYKVQMGVQVIDEKKRRTLLKRQSSNSAIAKAIDLLKKEKIFVLCDTILGLPGEENDDLEKLASFYDEHSPDQIHTFILRYYPKTNILKWAAENRFISEEEIANIEEGKVIGGTHGAGGNLTGYSRKFILLLNLFQFLPRPLRKLILRNKLYRILPSRYSPVILYVVARALNRARYDVNISRTLKRYTYFMMRHRN